MIKDAIDVPGISYYILPIGTLWSEAGNERADLYTPFPVTAHRAGGQPVQAKRKQGSEYRMMLNLCIAHPIWLYALSI